MKLPNVNLLLYDEALDYVDAWLDRPLCDDRRANRGPLSLRWLDPLR